MPETLTIDDPTRRGVGCSFEELATTPLGFRFAVPWTADAL
jgi:hypothetical protein